MLTQETDDQEMIIQAETQILENKVMKLEVRRWKKSILETLKQFIQLFCTRLTVFIPPPPSSARQSQHTQKKYNSKPQLLHPKGTAILSACHGSLASPHRHESVASCLVKAEMPDSWLPISCRVSEWFCLAATLLHTIHSFIIACKEKISHRISTK